ncbi:MAG TPA: DUF2780 domain-containing protein [Aestuariivirgaceae bacterium]|nr:DUF2780 domain-containing protein [Aestuariivirgaceae bacterium]
MARPRQTPERSRMRLLIDRISQSTGLTEDRAETALGITLALIRSQGKAESVKALFAQLPGADALADRHGNASSGLLGRLGGGLMGAPLVAVSQLQAAGLSMAQIKTLGGEVLAYAKEKAGDELVRDVAGSIPGLSGYV